MPRSATPCHLRLDISGEGSVVSRVSQSLIAALADGQLVDGDPMPSTRTLASHLGVARTAVVAAYEELTASGYLASRAGSGTRVEVGASRASRAGAYTSTVPTSTPPADAPHDHRTPIKYNLLSGYPDPTILNQREWTRAWRQSVDAALSPPLDVGLPDNSLDGPGRHEFFPGLRHQLANHLRQSRGVLCDPEDLFVFPGVNAAIRVLSSTLLEVGSTVAFEDPGYSTGRNILSHVGVQLRGVPVDDSGLCVERLRPSDSAVYVTPSHQFPLGARMSVERRARLLDWAAANDALVFEDDYDGEFRYDVPPMPALRSMPAGSGDVVYIGTSSKILARDLRIAWAVIPSRFRRRVRARLLAEGDAVNPVAAATLERLIENGALLRQITFSHRHYAARRARFTEACASLLPAMRRRGVEAGLHVVLSAPEQFDDQQLVADLLERGLACTPLSSYYLDPTNPSDTGLVCGYARLPETQAREAVEVIRQTLGPRLR